MLDVLRQCKAEEEGDTLASLGQTLRWHRWLTVLCASGTRLARTEAERRPTRQWHKQRVLITRELMQRCTRKHSSISQRFLLIRMIFHLPPCHQGLHIPHRSYHSVLLSGWRLCPGRQFLPCRFCPAPNGNKPFGGRDNRIYMNSEGRKGEN